MQSTVFYQLIDTLSLLVSQQGLAQAQKGEPVVRLARAHLFTALRQLDGWHKGLAIQFLYEAGLIGAHFVADLPPLPPVLALHGADLSGLLLPRANLAWAHLAVSDLTGADLRESCLICANLYAVDLVDADLAGANLCGANLYMAELSGANLAGADLRSAVVAPTQLASARVTAATRLLD